MDTQLLNTFLEVYRTRHFGRAAENLHLSQSAVSARIRLLEEELGIELFTRDRNNIQLTAAGRKLLRHAENITSAWNRARHDLAMAETGPELLAVGAVPSLWDIALQDWVHWLRRERQQLVLSAEAQGADVLLRKLLEGNLDLAFMFDAPQMPELMVTEVMPVALIMVATKPGLTAAQALNDYVMVDWGTSFAITHARYFPDSPAPRARVGLGRMAQALILECGGAAYLAEPMVGDLLKAGTLFQVEDAPVIERTAYAVAALNGTRSATIGSALQYFSLPREALRAGA
ncbi:MAG: LysR family transcriptional regulator [Thiogranum sp.]|nr:LysR family transcriptional regulator [Thiogranum sp.]